MENFAWLTGKWLQKDNRTTTIEEWKLNRDELTGSVYQQMDAETDTTEYLIIKLIGGKIVYIASPVNQKPTLFNLVHFTADEFAFENPEHSFPQRIIYKKNSRNSIKASVEGYYKNDFLRMDFNLNRVID